MHFPLHPETPAEGRSMAELYAGRNVDPEAMYQRMKGLMDAEGLPYGRRTHTYNSRLAQELGKWADTQPGGGRSTTRSTAPISSRRATSATPRCWSRSRESVGLPADGGARGPRRAPLQGRGRRRLGEIARLRRHRRADLCRRALRRRRRPALRGAGGVAREGRRGAPALSARGRPDACSEAIRSSRRTRLLRYRSSFPRGQGPRARNSMNTASKI